MWAMGEIKIEKRPGPSTDFCRTTVAQLVMDDLAVSNWTNWLQEERQEQKHATTILEMLKLVCNILRKMSWSIVSKAALGLKKR